MAVPGQSFCVSHTVIWAFCMPLRHCTVSPVINMNICCVIFALDLSVIFYHCLCLLCNLFIYLLWFYWLVVQFCFVWHLTNVYLHSLKLYGIALNFRYYGLNAIATDHNIMFYRFPITQHNLDKSWQIIINPNQNVLAFKCL